MSIGGFRFSSGEEIAPQARPAHQMFACLAYRRKRAQPLRETLRERGSVEFGRLRGSGKKQTRLEKRKPRRHDQIVGGKLEAQFSRGLDEQQILLGQRENGNARQVDPLPSSKLQQQVKRAFETIEIDGERGLARRLSEVEIATKPCPSPTNHLLGACWRSGSGQARAAQGLVQQGAQVRGS